MAIVEKTATYWECSICGMQYSWPIEQCMNASNPDHLNPPPPGGE
jgi:hypothetical protein